MDADRDPGSGTADGGAQGIAHVVVAGGTLGEWEAFGVVEWERRIGTLRDGVSGSGTHWVSLCPVSAGGDVDPERSRGVIASRVSGCPGIGEVPGRAGRFVHRVESSDVSVVIDTCEDGRRRFAEVVEQMRTAGITDPDENALTRHLMAPCPHEPDLVVVLGRPDTLPASLVWELAYSELVFLDLGWADLGAAHLEMAVEDFRRRDRRFGGLDS